MPIKPESTFIKGVHSFLPISKVYHMKNNNNYVGGIPDVWYSGRICALWVEYKFLPITKPTAPVIPDLSHQQLRWIKDRLREGRHVWTIVGSKKGGVIFYDIEEMEKGIPAVDYMKRLITRKELANMIQSFCHGGSYANT